MEFKPSENRTEERLAWHKPQVQRLEVTLDTQFRIGSNADLNEGDLLED
jgi:hypothetical protein